MTDVIFRAIADNDIAMVQTLLQQNLDLKQVNEQGYTPLSFAVIKRLDVIVDVLIAHGADLNEKSRDIGFTALHFAIDGDNFDMAIRLVEAGADVNAIDDKYGNNIIGFAMNDGPQRIPLIELLLKKGADPKIKNKHGISALDRAKNNSKGFQFAASAYDGYDLHKRAYMLAVQVGDIDAVKARISEGCDLYELHKDGGSALHITVIHNRLEMATILLEAGFDVNVGNYFGTPALRSAAGMGQLEMTELLISHGADVNWKDDDGKKGILERALTTNAPNKDEMIKLLIKHGAV